jgi:hypothetical protein
MSQHVSNVVELIIGAGCLGAAFATWRLGSFRWLAGVFAVAGLAAAVHAVVSLAP